MTRSVLRVRLRELPFVDDLERMWAQQVQHISSASGRRRGCEGHVRTVSAVSGRRVRATPRGSGTVRRATY